MIVWYTNVGVMAVSLPNRRAAEVVFVTQSLPCFQGGHVLSQSIVPMDVAGERSHVLSRVFRVNKLHRVARSEEHTSELQSRGHLVCRPRLEKKKAQP